MRSQHLRKEAQQVISIIMPQAIKPRVHACTVRMYTDTRIECTTFILNNIKVKSNLECQRVRRATTPLSLHSVCTKPSPFHLLTLLYCTIV